jgi:hypothetical protein
MRLCFLVFGFLSALIKQSCAVVNYYEPNQHKDSIKVSKVNLQHVLSLTGSFRNNKYVYQRSVEDEFTYLLEQSRPYLTHFFSGFTTVHESLVLLEYQPIYLRLDKKNRWRLSPFIGIYRSFEVDIAEPSFRRELNELRMNYLNSGNYIHADVLLEWDTLTIRNENTNFGSMLSLSLSYSYKRLEAEFGLMTDVFHFRMQKGFQSDGTNGLIFPGVKGPYYTYGLFDLSVLSTFSKLAIRYNITKPNYEKGSFLIGLNILNPVYLTGGLNFRFMQFGLNLKYVL